MILTKFYLPFPPSVNQLYPTAGKMRVKSAEYKAWIIKANEALNKQIIPAVTERCILTYNFNHPDGRIRDAENYAKGITDLLVNRGIIQEDCRRYVKGTCCYWNDIAGKLVEVVIESVENS